MPYYNTVIEKFQGKLPKGKKYIFSKIIKCNHIIDVVKMTRKPKCHIKRLKGKQYLNLKTGEVKEYMPKIEGQQFRNIRSLKKIFRDLRQLITTNFEGADCEQFCTLTYRGELQTNDPAKIQKDLDIFNKRLRRKFPDVGYIHIVEPHASGNWHVHSLLKDITGARLSFDRADMRELWGLGYVTIEDLENVDNIGAYFIAYFSNMEISDEDLHKYPDDIKEKDGKRYIKGKRLDYYPDYMKIYRNSKNLKKPEETTGIDKDFEQTYETQYKITSTDADGNAADTYVKKEQHKRK